MQHRVQDRHRARGVHARRLACCLMGIAGCSGPPAEVEEAVRSQGGERKVVISMTDNMRFDPGAPTVFVGDTIVWVTKGTMPT